MRVTNNMMIQSMVHNIGKNLGRLEDIQLQQATGKKIQKPSDDPVAASRSLKFKNFIAEIEQYQKNADDAVSWMELSEDALNDLGNNLTRVRELAVQASNGTYSEDDLNSIKQEITEIKKHIVDLSNTSYAGRYVFGGYDTDKPPFEIKETETGEKIFYKGKLLNFGGAVTGTMSDSAYENYLMEHLDSQYGLPELKMGRFEPFTAAAPNIDFKLTLDGVTQTISLTDGKSYDMDSIVSELQSKISDAFPSAGEEPDPCIKVTNDDGRIKITALKGDSLAISDGLLRVERLGFHSGAKSTGDADESIGYDIGLGNVVDINTEGDELFGSGAACLFETLEKLELALDGNTSYKSAAIKEEPAYGIQIETHELGISDLLEDLDRDIGRVLTKRTELGAKTKYVELSKKRLDKDFDNISESLSKNEDVDFAEASIKYANAEYLYKASLSAGSKTIQTSLIDFLR